MENYYYYNYTSCIYNNLVEAHCYGIDRTGQILEQSCSRDELNVKRFDHGRLLYCN